MKRKLIVIGMGIGLVILIITAGIAYQNYELAQQAQEETSTLKIVIQQKDIAIAKLKKEITSKQDELNGFKTELNNVNKALNDAKASINKVVPQPVVPAAQTVNK